MNRSRRVSGKVLTKRVCREIIRCGLENVLTARYIPTHRAVRVGVPTAQGSIDCGIDYPAEPEQIHGVLETLHHYAMSHQQGLKRAFRAGPHLKKAA